MPIWRATTAACEVRPPVAVSTPLTTAIPAMSLVATSFRTRMAGVPRLENAVAASTENAAGPTATPMPAGMARPTGGSLDSTRLDVRVSRSMADSRRKASAGPMSPLST